MVVGRGGCCWTLSIREIKRGWETRGGQKANLKIEQLESRYTPAIITVTGTGDTIAVDGIVTLREAITSANLNVPVNSDVVAVGAFGVDTIRFEIAANDPRHFYYLDDKSRGTVSRVDASQNSTLRTTISTSDATLPLSGLLSVDPDWMHDWFSIQLNTSLPDISESLTIDGYTQAGALANSNPINSQSNEVLRVELTAPPGNEFDGLRVTGGTVAIRGLAIHGFGFFQKADAIELRASNARITGNHLGTDVSGLERDGITGSAVLIDNVAGNVIGGEHPGEGNLIVGGRDGVRIAGSGAVANLVKGNRIREQPNGAGVLIADGASFNTVGGAAAGSRNVIEQCQYGILINGANNAGIPSQNQVVGNYIGINVSGGAGLPCNTGISIVNSPDNIIGGLTEKAGTGFGNVIASFQNSIHIALPASTGNTIAGNLIGTDASGVRLPGAYGQFYSGILLGGGGGNIVGGDDPKSRNVVSGSKTMGGISLQEGNSVVRNNFIGTDVNGKVDLGNGGGGVQVASSGNSIENNLIAYNHSFVDESFVDENGDNFGSGIIILSGESNAILGNSIFGNAKLGIEMLDGAFPDGVPVPNDLGDPDTGPNHLQNSPVLSGASIGRSDTTVSGSFNELANSRFQIEFFSSKPEFNNSGCTYLGRVELVTDPNGNATFAAKVTTPPLGQTLVTSTATLLTDGDNNPLTPPTPSETSEFSASVATSTPGGIASVSIDDATIVEGDAGIRFAEFSITLVNPPSQPVAVLLATTQGTASSGIDYFSLAKTLTFRPGAATTQKVLVRCLGDRIPEGNELFYLNILHARGAVISDRQGVGAILNDDTFPAVMIANTEVLEGNIGERVAVFTISLSQAPLIPVSLFIRTADDSATSPGDYRPFLTRLTFTPNGPTTQQVRVRIRSNLIKQANRSFNLILEGITNASNLSARAVGTIVDDD